MFSPAFATTFSVLTVSPVRLDKKSYILAVCAPPQTAPTVAPVAPVNNAAGPVGAPTIKPPVPPKTPPKVEPTMIDASLVYSAMSLN